jgi:transmembrane sensor
MKLQMKERMTVREQAAWWVAELQGAPSGAETRFALWLKESPRHVEEFLFFNALWRELDGVDGDRSINLDALIAEAKAGHAASNVTPLTVDRQDPDFRTVRVSGWRLAAVVAAVAVAIPIIWLGIVPLFSGARTYATEVGEQRAVKLADGSFAHLNTHTKIKVNYSRHGRDLQLVEGEALFSVRPDVARPFRVQSGDAVVQAIGTEFNVYRHKGATTVSVIEGAVQVLEEISTTSRVAPRRAGSALPFRISAGEQADVISPGEIVKHAAPDIDKAVAWRARRLIFRSESLADVAAEFNRYNDVKIQVRGDAVASRRLIATFDSDDPESLVRFLATEENLAVERTGGSIVIRSRR